MTTSITPKLLSTWVTQAPKGMGNAGLLQNLGGRLQLLNEGDHGLSKTVFAQHLLMTWAPKMAASRSWAERAEVTFLEVLETFLVYFGIPLTAQHLFRPILQKGLSKVEQGLLLESVGTILKKHPQAAARVLPVKAAIVLAAMVAGGAGWEYALTFAKNLLTVKAFKKDSFKHIANLEAGQMKRDVDDSPVVHKAWKRIGESLAVLGATFGAAFLLARFGHKFAAVKKASGIFLEVFDFNITKHFDEAKKFTGFTYGLTNAHNRFFIATAFVAYMDAIRDKLEAMEVFTRLSVTMSYLAFGNTLIDKVSTWWFNKHHPELMVFDEKPGLLQRIREIHFEAPVAPGKVKPEIMPLEALAKKFKGEARTQAPHMGEEALDAMARQRFWKAIPAKISLFLLLQALGLGIAGFGNAFLNRYWTAHRFKENKAGVQQESGELFSVWGFLKEKLTGKTTAVTAPPMSARAHQPVSARTMTSPVMQPVWNAQPPVSQPAMSWKQPVQPFVWPGMGRPMMPMAPSGVSAFRMPPNRVIPGNWLPAAPSTPVA